MYCLLYSAHGLALSPIICHLVSHPPDSVVRRLLAETQEQPCINWIKRCDLSVTIEPTAVIVL